MISRIRNALIGVAAMAALVIVAAYDGDILVLVLRVVFNVF